MPKAITPWFQTAVLLAALLAAAIHVDRRITHLEDHLEAFTQRQAETENRLNKLEHFQEWEQDQSRRSVKPN